MNAMTFAAQAECRMNLSAHHMMAAAQFARESGKIEKEHEGQPLGQFYEDITIRVVSTIIMSACSLEAFINEIFLDANIHLVSAVAEIENNWPTIEKTEILEKFRTAMEMAGTKKMNKGIPVYQNAHLLIDMRNALVHFKPEWSHEKKGHFRIENKIHNQFPLSPFWQGVKAFPEKCMSYGCAKWCVGSAMEFAETFCQETGIVNKYLHFKNRIIV
jgi:hypothetical protein